MRTALVRTVSLLILAAAFCPGSAAQAQGSPSIEVAQGAGDTDGALARAIVAALDAQLAPGGVQAACQIKREEANAATRIEASLDLVDGTAASRVALLSQPGATAIRPTAEFGPAPSVDGQR